MGGEGSIFNWGFYIRKRLILPGKAVWRVCRSSRCNGCRERQWGWAQLWSTCLLCMEPWGRSPALIKPGLVKYTCSPCSRAAGTGQSEGQCHSLLHHEFKASLAACDTSFKGGGAPWSEDMERGQGPLCSSTAFLLDRQWLAFWQVPSAPPP